MIVGRHLRAPLVLALLAIVVYAPWIGWGLPRANAPDRVKTFATDEILPLEGLAEMHSTFVASKPDRNYGYPWMHYFVVASAQAPYLLYLKLTGGMGAPTPDYPFGLDDPVSGLRTLTLIGRGVSVLMGAGVVVCTYLFALTLWGPAVGWIAALLTLFNYPLLYYARTGNLDVPMTFWTMLGAVVFARILAHGTTTRRAVWLGLFAALAMGTKDQALIQFLPFGLALLLPAYNGSANRPIPWKPLLAGLGVSLVAYVAATGMFVDPQRHLIHVQRLMFAPETVSVAAAYHPPAASLIALGAESLRALADTMAPPVLLASLVGLAITARSRPRLLVFVAPLLLLFALLYVPTGLALRRYLLPMVPFVDIFAACAVMALYRRAGRAAAVAMMLVLLGWRAGVAVDLGWAQSRDRVAAAAWLETNAQPGQRLEHFGPAGKLPRIPRWLSSRRVAGREEFHGEKGHGAYVLEYLGRNGPDYLVIAPDWTSRPGMRHSGDCPPEVWQALNDGSAGYSLAFEQDELHLLPPPLRRPPLDNPSVGPPLRIFIRDSVE